MQWELANATAGTFLERNHGMSTMPIISPKSSKMKLPQLPGKKLKNSECKRSMQSEEYSYYEV